jgi:GST-like protein
MIDVYTWKSPGGNKIHIMLEETGLAYRVNLVNIAAGEQRGPAFLKINPNAKIPAILDDEGPDRRPFAVFESGAILFYLAEKTGRFLPKGARERAGVLEWLMFEASSIGPMFGQCYHFRSTAPERIPYAINRYTNEVGRLYGVLDRRFALSEYVAGEYSIADIALWPWVKNPSAYNQAPEDFPNVMRWSAQMAEKPAVKRGLKALEHK